MVAHAHAHTRTAQTISGEGGPGLAVQSRGIRKHRCGNYSSMQLWSMHWNVLSPYWSVLMCNVLQHPRAGAEGQRETQRMGASTSEHACAGTTPHVLRPAAPGEPASEARAGKQRGGARRQAGRPQIPRDSRAPAHVDVKTVHPAVEHVALAVGVALSPCSRV